MNGPTMNTKTIALSTVFALGFAVSATFVSRMIWSGSVPSFAATESTPLMTNVLASGSDMSTTSMAVSTRKDQDNSVVLRGPVPGLGVVQVLNIGGLPPVSGGDEAILRQTRVLPEALVPAGVTQESENIELSETLRRFSGGSDSRLLDEFLKRNPQSAWRVSLLVNLGILEVSDGFMTRAMERFRQAWESGRDLVGDDISAIVDRAVGEYALLNAWVGRYDELDRVFAEIGERGLRGVGSNKIAAARNGRQAMIDAPESSFKCGPYAVESIGRIRGIPMEAMFNRVMGYPSTAQGTSLLQVQQLAKDLGMEMRAARRLPDGALVAPAVVHWSLGHFSAILSIDGERVLIEDRTMDAYFGKKRWISLRALHEESSGAFLIPGGDLPPGWAPIAAEEQASIWGKGDTGPNNEPEATANCDIQHGGNGGGCHGMANYSIHSLLVSLRISDLPVSYPLPEGSLGVQVTYNEKDAMQPAVQTITNFGPKWTCDWVSCVVDDAADLDGEQSVMLVLPGGGGHRYALTGGRSTANRFSGAYLRRIDEATYELTMPSGVRHRFAQPDGGTGLGRRVYLSQVVDADDRVTAISYEPAGSGLRITHVTDYLGQQTVFSYGSPTSLQPVRIADPFGRAATFTYDQGRLAGITDPVGITSSFRYVGSSDVISSMITPYGTTQFRRGSTGMKYSRYIEAVDPQGDVERVEYALVKEFNYDGERLVYPIEGRADTAFGTMYDIDRKFIPATPPGGIGFQNAWFVARNSFYWDKKAWKMAPGNYHKAYCVHWLHEASLTLTSRIPECIKPAESARIFFNYPGQVHPTIDAGITVAKPSVVARRIDGDVDEYVIREFLPSGALKSYADPLGRRTDYSYAANGLDVTEVRQSAPGQDAVVVAQYNWDDRRRLVSMTDASGGVSRYGHDERGRPVQFIDPRGVVTVMQYEERGYRTSASDLLGRMVPETFRYDHIGRPSERTLSDGGIVRYTYDDLDRLTGIHYPDKTSITMEYDKLDLVLYRDRAGRETRYIYNPLRQIKGIIDPMGQVTAYEWCKCGALQELVDAKGNRTSMRYDVDGRMISKKWPDGSEESYGYDTRSGRLSSVRDPTGLITRYTHHRDGRLASVSYERDGISTAGHSIRYDDLFGRVSEVTDGTGTTTMRYHPLSLASIGAGVVSAPGAGELAVLDGPGSDDAVSFEYDVLGRLTARRLGVNESPERFEYDGLGRVRQVSNGLGDFTFGYMGLSDRMTSVNYPNGLMQRRTYGNHTQAYGLESIDFLRLGNQESLLNHTYEYQQDGGIARWTIGSGNDRGSSWQFQYDALSRLRLAMRSKSNNLSAVQQAYDYDAMGNMTRVQSDESSWAMSSNSLNQLMSATADGLVRISGTISEPGTVSVNGVAAHVSRDLTWTVSVPRASLTEGMQVTAVDLHGNPAVLKYDEPVARNQDWRRWYDANGNLASDGNRDFTWDSANRLSMIRYADGKRSAFAYDAFGNLVSIREFDGEDLVEERQLVWNGTVLWRCVVTRPGQMQIIRFYDHGEMVDGAKFFYLTDHLGSVQRVVNEAGQVVGVYDYDAFGQRRVITEVAPFSCERGYAGMLVHRQSGLMIASYRFYDPAVGRWLNRDPLGERGGLNLYAYADNNPVNRLDPHGLSSVPSGDMRAVGAVSQSASTATRPGDSVVSGTNQFSPSDSQAGRGLSVMPGAPVPQAPPRIREIPPPNPALDNGLAAPRQGDAVSSPDSRRGMPSSPPTMVGFVARANGRPASRQGDSTSPSIPGRSVPDVLARVLSSPEGSALPAAPFVDGIFGPRRGDATSVPSYGCTPAIVSMCGPSARPLALYPSVPIGDEGAELELTGVNGLDRLVLNVDGMTRVVMRTKRTGVEIRPSGGFRSSDDSVATISSDGSITARRPGLTTITQAEAVNSLSVYVVRIGIVADTNRDGVIDPALDAVGKQAWTKSLGAIYSVNMDDDDSDGYVDSAIMSSMAPDADRTLFTESLIIENVEDVSDITPVTILPTGQALPDGAMVRLSIGDADEYRAFHFFMERRPGAVAVWGGLASDARPMSLYYDISSHVTSATEELDCGLEGTLFRSSDPAYRFSGYLNISVELVDRGRVVHRDPIRLKVAPWIMSSNAQPADTVYTKEWSESVDMGRGNLVQYFDNRKNIYSALAYPGNYGVDAAAPVVNTVDGQMFIQDSCEIGYTQRPGGPIQRVLLALPYPYGGQDPTAKIPRKAPHWPYKQYLAPHRGVYCGLTSGGAVTLSGEFGGNIECLPPTPEHPLGVVMMGNLIGNSNVKRFVQDQEVQPVFADIPTDWLSVGHIDEVVAFLPDGRVAIASPRLAYHIIDQLDEESQKTSYLFAGRGECHVGSVSGSMELYFIDGAGLLGADFDSAISQTSYRDAYPGLYPRVYDGTAHGDISVVDAGRLVDGESMLLVDQEGRSLRFEFDKDGSISSGFRVDIASHQGVEWSADVVASRLADAINSVAGGVRAIVNGPGRVHVWFGSRGASGNRTIIETVADPAYKAVGMSGGSDSGTDFRLLQNMKYIRISKTPTASDPRHENTLVALIQGHHDGFLEVGYVTEYGMYLGRPTDRRDVLPNGVNPASEWLYHNNASGPRLIRPGHGRLAREVLAGEDYVLFDECLNNYGAKIPPMFGKNLIQTKEFASDLALRNFNVAILEDVINGARDDSVRMRVERAAGRRVEFVEIPVIYGNDVIPLTLAEFEADRRRFSAVAHVANSVNMMIGGVPYIPDPTGPRDDAGRNFFREAILKALPNARFVSTWEWHVHEGEVHCATAVDRLPVEGMWWKVLR
jgi:RHS repeat-associated protein